MQRNIQVTCLIDRFWNPSTKEYNGTRVSGTLINISTQHSEDEPEKLYPVGIVVTADGSFHSVPVEFIEYSGSNPDPIDSKLLYTLTPKFCYVIPVRVEFQTDDPEELSSTLITTAPPSGYGKPGAGLALNFVAGKCDYLTNKTLGVPDFNISNVAPTVYASYAAPTSATLFTEGELNPDGSPVTNNSGNPIMVSRYRIVFNPAHYAWNRTTADYTNYLSKFYFSAIQPQLTYFRNLDKLSDLKEVRVVTKGRIIANQSSHYYLWTSPENWVNGGSPSGSSSIKYTGHPNSNSAVNHMVERTVYPGSGYYSYVSDLVYSCRNGLYTVTGTYFGVTASGTSARAVASSPVGMQSIKINSAYQCNNTLGNSWILQSSLATGVMTPETTMDFYTV